MTARPASTAYDPQVGEPGEPANTLQRATWALAVTENAAGQLAAGEEGGPAGTVRTSGANHASGQMVAEPVGFRQSMSPGGGAAEGVAPTVLGQGGNNQPAVAEPLPVALRGREHGGTAEAGDPGDPAFALRGPGGGGSMPMVAGPVTASAGKHADQKDMVPDLIVTPPLMSGGSGHPEPGYQLPVVPVDQYNTAAGAPGGPGYTVRTEDGGAILGPIPIGQDALHGEGVARTPSPDGTGRETLRDPGLGIGAPGAPAQTVAASGPGAVAWRGGSTQDTVTSPDGTSPTLAFSSGTHQGHHEPKVISVLGDVAPPLAADDSSEDGTGRGGGYTPVAVPAEDGAITGRVLEPGELAAEYGVRRLTPKECERLQGFPDNWTAGQADSVRYRQMGNAVAVPVAGWVGRRIAAAHAQVLARRQLVTGP